jgi:RNA polymerase sigma-70 factor, ECF subfamily
MVGKVRKCTKYPSLVIVLNRDLTFSKTNVILVLMEDDSLYVKQVQAGNAESFGVLYDRYIDKIYRFIYYKTFNKETAEDLTSEVFHKALVKISSFDLDKGGFSTWLYQIARNRVIDYYRTAKSVVPLEDVFDIGVDERTPETLDAVAKLAQVTEYLQTLSAKQREIITLRVWEEKSYREIAELVGGSEDSVKMAYSRSIKELREKCGPVSLTLLFVASSTLREMSRLPFADFS